jgi:hypothetical protein
MTATEGRDHFGRPQILPKHLHYELQPHVSRSSKNLDARTCQLITLGIVVIFMNHRFLIVDYYC